MAHFGIVSPPSASHITGFAAIGRELIRHGHRATWLTEGLHAIGDASVDALLVDKLEFAGSTVESS